MNQQERLLQRTREVLQQQAENIPADVARKLQQGRNRALMELTSSAPSQSPFYHKGLAVALLMLVVGAGVWFALLQADRSVFSPDDIHMAQDQSLSPEEIELLENLEFYRWLAQQKQHG